MARVRGDWSKKVAGTFRTDSIGGVRLPLSARRSLPGSKRRREDREETAPARHRNRSGVPDKVARRPAGSPSIAMESLEDQDRSNKPGGDRRSCPGVARESSNTDCARRAPPRPEARRSVRFGCQLIEQPQRGMPVGVVAPASIGSRRFWGRSVVGAFLVRKNMVALVC